MSDLFDRYDIDPRYYRHLGKDQIAEIAPRFCPRGHRFGPQRVGVGWAPCKCTQGFTGHRTYTCLTCPEVMTVPSCVHRPGWVTWLGDDPENRSAGR